MVAHEEFNKINNILKAEFGIDALPFVSPQLFLKLFEVGPNTLKMFIDLCPIKFNVRQSGLFINGCNFYNALLLFFNSRRHNKANEPEFVAMLNIMATKYHKVFKCQIYDECCEFEITFYGDGIMDVYDVLFDVPNEPLDDENILIDIANGIKVERGAMVITNANYKTYFGPDMHIDANTKIILPNYSFELFESMLANISYDCAFGNIQEPDNVTQIIAYYKKKDIKKYNRSFNVLKKIMLANQHTYESIIRRATIYVKYYEQCLELPVPSGNVRLTN